MIHTAELSIVLDKEHLQFRENHYGTEPINQILHMHMIKGISIVEFSNKPIAFCKLVIDIPLILNRGNVDENDYEQVESYIRRALSIVYGDVLLFEQHNLSRIDYRFDVEISNENIRKIYLELFRKLKKKTAHLEKKIYFTSQYHQCKSIHIIFYDKEQERGDKNEHVERWERGVMRFEVSVEKNHLKYKKYKKGEPRFLKDYFKKEKYAHYMNNYILNICPTGDFYSYAKLEAIIASLDLSTREKLQMKEIVKCVSKGSLDTAAEKYSASTYRKYLKLFNEHGINPITIPPKYKLNYLESLVKQAVL
ncbi:hypothetical protein [Lysinibacillus sp. FSL M8-0355]|uniref:hypothetical protein n=1 Tax=Lysinibacillus sp. FSL M8-0355 TaxID=2921719 RepID=UPI0030F86755